MGGPGEPRENPPGQEEDTQKSGSNDGFWSCEAATLPMPPSQEVIKSDTSEAAETRAREDREKPLPTEQHDS